MPLNPEYTVIRYASADGETTKISVGLEDHGAELGGQLLYVVDGREQCIFTPDEALQVAEEMIRLAGLAGARA